MLSDSHSSLKRKACWPHLSQCVTGSRRVWSEEQKPSLLLNSFNKAGALLLLGVSLDNLTYCPMYFPSSHSVKAWGWDGWQQQRRMARIGWKFPSKVEAGLPWTDSALGQQKTKCSDRLSQYLREVNVSFHLFPLF